MRQATEIGRASSAPETLDAGVHGWNHGEECEGGGWEGRGRMPPVSALGWVWSFQVNVKQHIPKSEKELEGLDETLAWHLSVQHAPGSGNLAAQI